MILTAVAADNLFQTTAFSVQIVKYGTTISVLNCRHTSYIWMRCPKENTCEVCSNMDSDFSRKYEKLMALSRADELRQEQNRGLDKNTRPLKSMWKQGHK